MRFVRSVRLLIAFSAPVSVANAQDTIPFLVRVEDRGRVGPRDRIVIRDPQTGADREIYRARHSQGHLPYPVTLSPDGHYLAFMEVLSQTGDGKVRLTVLDRSGQIVRLLGESSVWAARGIREHLWCCGPHILAIVVGRRAPSELPSGESSDMPPGISLIDIRTGATVTHLDGLRFPQHLHWAAFDSTLYIKDVPDVPPGTRGPVTWPIYRYHVPSARLIRTTHVGTFLSPDGRYYFDPSVEGSEFRLYRTADDQDVTQRLALPKEQIKWGPEFGWMPGADHVLLFIDKPARPEPQPGQPRQRARLMDRNVPQLYPDRWNLAVDAETGGVIDRFQGDLGAGWKSHPPMLPVERRTGVEFVRPPR